MAAAIISAPPRKVSRPSVTRRSSAPSRLSSKLAVDSQPKKQGAISSYIADMETSFLCMQKGPPLEGSAARLPCAVPAGAGPGSWLESEAGSAAAAPAAPGGIAAPAPARLVVEIRHFFFALALEAAHHVLKGQIVALGRGPGLPHPGPIVPAGGACRPGTRRGPPSGRRNGGRGHCPARCAGGPAAAV